MKSKASWLGLCLLAAALLAAPAQAGMVVKGHCAACGYDTGGLSLFGGRANFQSVCMFPVLCSDCGKLETVNLLDARAACRQCPKSPMIAYDDPRLRGAAGSREVASWNLDKLGRSLVLTDGAYYCPACRGYELRFTRTAMWD